MAAIGGETEEENDDRPPARMPSPPAGRPWLRFLPIAFVVAGLGAGYAAGLQHYLSLAVLAQRRADLAAFVAAHGAGAGLLFVVAYALAVALSFPAASVLTVAGGFLFGWLTGGVLTAIAATAGATAIFLAARTAFGETLKRRAGPTIEKLAGGFEDDAFSYLLALRLAPVFPFFAVNIAAAFFNVGLGTYVAATALGILPATFAYAYLGQGLDGLVAAAGKAGRDVSLSDLVTWRLTLAFALLALLAVAPALVRRLWRGR